MNSSLKPESLLNIIVFRPSFDIVFICPLYKFFKHIYYTAKRNRFQDSYYTIIYKFNVLQKNIYRMDFCRKCFITIKSMCEQYKNILCIKKQLHIIIPALKRLTRREKSAPDGLKYLFVGYRDGDASCSHCQSDQLFIPKTLGGFSSSDFSAKACAKAKIYFIFI